VVVEWLDLKVKGGQRCCYVVRKRDHIPVRETRRDSCASSRHSSSAPPRRLNLLVRSFVSSQTETGSTLERKACSQETTYYQSHFATSGKSSQNCQEMFLRMECRKGWVVGWARSETRMVSATISATNSKSIYSFAEDIGWMVPRTSQAWTCSL
jgi:hypothetical protein